MRYPFTSPVIIDVTKPPYCADNTGTRDCTDVLRRVLDDLLIRERDGIQETAARLEAMRSPDRNVYVGFESRIKFGRMRVIFPEYTPPARIIYFPAGIYLVSDTVTYTLTDLYNIFADAPFCTMTRGIHLMGEDRERTVIRLKDHAAGFERGQKKPVLTYTTDPRACETERSNVSQLNTCTDLTIDCGEGNEGAVGLRFVANNSGRIENLRVIGHGADCGIELVCGCEGVIRNVVIEDTQVGLRGVYTSVCVLEQIDLLRMKRAGLLMGAATLVCHSVTSKDAPLLEHTKEEHGTYVFTDCSDVGLIEHGHNRVYVIDGETVHGAREQSFPLSAPISFPTIPDHPMLMPEDIAFVDDFGARGDGKTDSTEAIRAAFASGCSTVIFGNGRYLVNGTVSVPPSVRHVDFLFCDLQAGERLIAGEDDALFRIEGESDEPLRMENLYTFEQFYGAFRLLCHANRRPLYLRDLHTQTAAMYFNTVPGGSVLLDNCVCTTGSYSMDTCLARDDVEPVFARMIPYEFHGQKVLAYNLNPERGNLEVLNDGSHLTVCCLKCEGPGTAVHTENGGETLVLTASVAIGNPKSTFPAFSCDKSGRLIAIGAAVRGALTEPKEEYPILFRRGDVEILRDKTPTSYVDLLNP